MQWFPLPKYTEFNKDENALRSFHHQLTQKHLHAAKVSNLIFVISNINVGNSTENTRFRMAASTCNPPQAPAMVLFGMENTASSYKLFEINKSDTLEDLI